MKAIFTHECDENYQKEVLYICAENEPPMKMNETALNNLPSELYTVKSNDKIPGNCKYPSGLTQAAQILLDIFPHHVQMSTNIWTFDRPCLY